jgi:hypothetical protein
MTVCGERQCVWCASARCLLCLLCHAYSSRPAPFTRLCILGVVDAGEEYIDVAFGVARRARRTHTGAMVAADLQTAVVPWDRCLSLVLLNHKPKLIR